MKMKGGLVFLLFFIFYSLLPPCLCSVGDEDSLYRSCVEQCEKTNCKNRVNGANSNGSGIIYFYSSLYLRWREGDCTNVCQYQCMMQRESERREQGLHPLKYHNKWPLEHVLSLEEPASVFFCVLNLVMHFHGWLSFLVLVYYKLPRRPHGNNSTYYEYSDIWLFYGLIAMNSWFWTAVFHSRDMEIMKMFDYSSALALLGFSLLFTIIRTFNLRIEVARVMVAAPIIGFVSTHILYLNVYEFDHGWNVKVSMAMEVIQLGLWIFWAGLTCHPSRFKLWFVIFAGVSALILEKKYDFPPLLGWFDAHSLRLAAMVPLTYLWWSFVKDDALFRTKQLQQRNVTFEDTTAKKVN